MFGIFYGVLLVREKEDRNVELERFLFKYLFLGGVFRKSRVCFLFFIFISCIRRRRGCGGQIFFSFVSRFYFFRGFVKSGVRVFVLWSFRGFEQYVIVFFSYGCFRRNVGGGSMLVLYLVLYFVLVIVRFCDKLIRCFKF